MKEFGLDAEKPVPALRADALELAYGEGVRRVQALRKLRLHVPAGQLLVVRGRSGSGKTSLLHVLSGIRKPDAGRVLIGDVNLFELSETEATQFRRRNIGIVYQFFNLIPTLDVEHNIALPLLLDGYRLSQLHARVRGLIARLGIEHRGSHGVQELSGGEMQRVAIARAVVANPVLVLADEPTGNLDSENGAEVLSLLRQLCDERGATTIVMTHDAEATAYADRVISLRDGEINEDSGLLRPQRGRG
jgi:putative ABC transport system ATP-binding protein